MTSASNAWSFGVTCWEILGLCRHRPFNLLSDDEVVQNAERVCYNDALQVHRLRVFMFTSSALKDKRALF